MTIKKAFAYLAAIIVACTSFSSCEKHPVDNPDIDNYNYAFVYSGFVLKAYEEIGLSKEQVELFKLFHEIYKTRMESIPGFTKSKSDDHVFTIEGKKFNDAFKAVQQACEMIPEDIERVSENLGYSLMDKINFCFIFQVAFQVSTGVGSLVHDKVYGEAYNVYGPAQWTEQFGR